MFTKNCLFLKRGRISKFRPTNAQKMLSSITDKKFGQIQDDLRVQTLTSVKHVQILKLLFSQAVTASRVPADCCGLACCLQNVVSFNCIYGFASLQLREIALFYSLLSLSGGA